MMQFLAYVPYAAAGYCVAMVADDIWPTLRSQLTLASRPASRHGMDGEARRSRMGPRASAVCEPDGPAVDWYRNQAVQRSSAYCFNTATGAIEGSGQLDGVVPPPGAVTVYVDEDGRETARISVGGDNKMDLLVCHVPGGTTPGDFSATPPGDDPPEPPDYYPPDDEVPPPGDPCGPRRQRGLGQPIMRRAECGPDGGGSRIPGPAVLTATVSRNHDPHRLSRKHMRWG